MEIDYGPLAGLNGTWRGDKGMDVSPEPDGSEESPYRETISFERIGVVENAGEQTLAAVRYQQIVRRKSDDEVFHDETGYWMWDAQAGTVMHSLTIPRAVCVLAGGSFPGPVEPGQAIILEVSASLDDPAWGILQSPFMRDHARTIEFRHRLSLAGDTLSYAETTVLEIYGKTFEHTDTNELTRSGA